MKTACKLVVFFSVGLLVAVSRTDAAGFCVQGQVIDGGTSQLLTNVEVDFLYDPLGSAVGALPISVSTNTDSNGKFNFDNLPGELSGGLQILTLPTGDFVPMKEEVRPSALTPTNEVIFRAGSTAVLTGSVVITSGTAAFTNFMIEVNGTVTNVAADGSFVIPMLSATKPLWTSKPTSTKLMTHAPTSLSTKPGQGQYTCDICPGAL